MSRVFAIVLGWDFVRHLGALGLLLTGILGDSTVPMPGAVDALTIILAASHATWWPFYAAVAATGSVVGGHIGYRLGRKGGKETLERKLPAQQVRKVYRTFERGGFGAVFLASILPPPAPLVPVVLASGALNYSWRKFLVALSLGRLLRFGVVAYLASRYGSAIYSWLGRYYQPVLIALVVLAVLGAGILIFLVHCARGKKK